MKTFKNPPRRAAATRVCVLIIACVCLCAPFIAAEEQAAAGLAAGTQVTGISSSVVKFVPLASSKVVLSHPLEFSVSARSNAAAETGKLATVSGPRRITLDQAQQQAAEANNPMLRLAALGLEAAKQHRLGVQSDFFPKLSSTFANLHFNKFMGLVFQVHRPLANITATVAVPLLNRDETLAAANVMQPITPLFKLQQVLVIARADERLAKAKIGQPAKETASNVEQAYFALLIVQRQQQAAAANANKLENKWRLASTSTAAAGIAAGETDWLKADRALVLASSRVKEATATLNLLLGWPLETELELVIPPPFAETVSAAAAVEEALQNNPEVIEAEQTLVKARAAAKLSKLDYVPDVAVVGGYAYQSAIPSLPSDFSYIGVTASYNLFDFGKREHAMKERNAQLAMAETGVLLVKAKVAGNVTKAYFELDRSRRLSELARRMNAVSPVVDARYEPEEAQAARTTAEAEMLQAELDHRQAFSRLQQLIGSTQLSVEK